MFILLKIARWILRILIALFVLSILTTLVYRWVPVFITPLMLIRCVEQKMEGKEVVLKHKWVSLEKISPKLQLAVVCSEDQNYLKHYGFDWKAIEKAFENNAENKRIKGGSTISQQTAKNVFLWPGRSYIRKAFEAYFTLLIETMWSKERIMEVYLNSIEMGRGIYGAEAAAQFWYKTSAAKLNKDQSAGIAAILPNPLKYKANPASPYINKRKEWVKRQMSYWGNQLDYDKYNDGEDEESKKPKEKSQKKKTSPKK
jgi:monofunctional biosynthetic peptidoglycan transglycosylase